MLSNKELDYLNDISELTKLEKFVLAGFQAVMERESVADVERLAPRIIETSERILLKLYKHQKKMNHG